LERTCQRNSSNSIGSLEQWKYPVLRQATGSRSTIPSIFITEMHSKTEVFANRRHADCDFIWQLGGNFVIQTTGVELDNLVRFRNPIAEIDLLFQALRTSPTPPSAPPPQVVNGNNGSEFYSCTSAPNGPCSLFPNPGVFTTGTANAMVYAHKTPVRPVPYVGPAN
jgi:hypothetical protein